MVLGVLALIIRKLGLKKVEAISMDFLKHPFTKEQQGTSEPETPAENKTVTDKTAQPQSLELPLELQAVLAAIKSKLHFSVDENSEDNTEDGSDNTYNDYSDYGNYNSFGNDGGGGGAYYPYQPPLVTPVVAATTTPLFSSVLTPVKSATLPIKPLTPTPTPNPPVLSTVHTASGARTSNNYVRRQFTRRRF